MNSALSKLPRRSFGELLKEEREEQGLSHREVAVRVGVDRDTVRAWETGESFPNRLQAKKLFGSMRKLRHYVHLLPEETQHEVQEDARYDNTPLPVQLAPIPSKPPPPASTFGEALRRERLSEGMSQEEVSELMSVTASAVGAWEAEVSTPITEHYEALILLFPALKAAPQPKTRDIDKPNGGAGKEKLRTGHNPTPIEGTTDMNRAPVSVRQVSPSTDLKLALIRWGRLVHALKSHPDIDVFMGFLAEANEAGMTLPEAMAALAEPK